MDAENFLKEEERMLRPQGRSTIEYFEFLANYSSLSKSERIRVVTEWSMKNPRKTRKDDLLKKYPEAPLRIDGIPTACCMSLGYCNHCITNNCGGSDCSTCWNTPLEEDTNDKL